MKIFIVLSPTTQKPYARVHVGSSEWKSVRASWPTARRPSCKLNLRALYCRLKWVGHSPIAMYYYSTLRLILIYRPDRRPFLSTLEPSPTPGDTGTESSAVDTQYAYIYFKYTSLIILMKVRSKTLHHCDKSFFSLSLGGRPSPKTPLIDATANTGQQRWWYDQCKRWRRSQSLP